MKRTNNLKKTLALILALVMSLSLSVSALAANVTLSIPDEGLALEAITDNVPSGVNYYYKVVSTDVKDYHPANFSLLVNATGSYTVQAYGGAVATQEGTTGQNYWLIIPSSSGESYVNITCGSEVSRIKLDVPSGGDAPTGTGIDAYLPAPGQFTNEGVTVGGWGDAYTKDTKLKGMVGEIASTGVSLGFFGGYVVFDMGKEGIKNDPSHPYGIDFIVYGNAFWNNSEPGCIQVSKDGTEWFDIAGSLYYNDATVRNASITYDNPNVAEDAGITKAGNNLGTMADVSYTLRDAAGTVISEPEDKVTTNLFHRHSWFPLNANYFESVDGRMDLAKVNNFSFVGEKPQDGVAGKLTMEGVLLRGIKATNDTASLGFGYCDVHPNNSGNINVAYNPYQTFTSSNDYNTKTSGTGGGDPIDLAWAVDKDGNPHNFTKDDVVRYVRIYTGTAAMNGAFGEISTEVCGIAAVTVATGSGEATSDLMLASQKTGVIPTVNGGSLEVEAGSYMIRSSESAVYLNGSKINATSVYTFTVESGKSYQIITQNGTESPYITVIIGK